MKRLDKSEVIFKVASYIILTLFALACLYPLIYVLSAAISSKEAMNAGKVVFLPVGFQLEAFKYVIKMQDFWKAYSNTIFFTIYGTLVSMLVAITGAYALSKVRLMWRRGFNFLLVFTMWFSAGMIPTLRNFDRFHVDNRYMFIIALGFNAFNIILLRNYFAGVPTEIEEAATIDGATEFQILSKIYIPMSKASIATVTMFYALSRWNGYLWAQMLLGPDDQPLQVIIRRYIEALDDDGAGEFDSFTVHSVQYAMIVCSIIPILIIYPMIQKYFAAGVNVGGVKE